MSVGRVVDKATVDGQIAGFGVQLNALFNQISAYFTTMEGITDNTLTVTGIPKSQSDATLVQYTSGEVATLRSAYRDLNKLRQVYAGLMYVTAGATAGTGVPTANDGTHFGYPFNQFVNQVDGFGY